MKRNFIISIIFILMFFALACDDADGIQAIEDAQTMEEVININLQTMRNLAQAGVGPMNQMQGIVSGYFKADEPGYYATIFREGRRFLISSEEGEELFWAYFGNWAADAKEQIGQINYDDYTLCVQISTQLEDVHDFEVKGLIIDSEDMSFNVSYVNSEYSLNVEFSRVIYAIVPNVQLQTSACKSWINIERLKEWEPIAIMCFQCAFSCEEFDELGMTPEDIIMLGEQYGAQEINAQIYIKDGEVEIIWLVLAIYNIDDAIQFMNEMSGKLPEHDISVWKYECTEDDLMRLQLNETELSLEFRIKEDTNVPAIIDYMENAYSLEATIEEEVLSFNKSEDSDNWENLYNILNEMLEEPYTEENYNIFYTKICEYES